MPSAIDGGPDATGGSAACMSAYSAAEHARLEEGARQEDLMRPIRHLRWYIGGLLFLSTVINYIDRQTLSVLAPYLKDEFRWSNSDFALVVIAFRVAYSIGQTVCGRWLDRVGTRAGL